MGRNNCAESRGRGGNFNLGWLAEPPSLPIPVPSRLVSTTCIKRSYNSTPCTPDVKTGAIILAMIGLLGGGFSVISDSVGLGYYAPLIEDKIDRAKVESMIKFEVCSY